MLIGDIWLRKRQAGSQHLLEPCNLKFHPLVSAEQARRDHVRVYTGQDQGASPPLSTTVVETPARRGDIKSSPRPARAEARRLRKWLPGPDLRRPRSLLSCFWGTGCFYVEWLAPPPKGLGGIALCVYVCGQAANQHARARRLHMGMSRVRGPHRPTSPHNISSPSMQRVWFINVHELLGTTMM